MAVKIMKNRIGGVSFKSSFFRTSGAKNKSNLYSEIELSELINVASLHKFEPPIVDKPMIRRYLFDRGRNELSGAVSHAIKQVELWGNVLVMIDKYSGDTMFFNEEVAIDSDYNLITRVYKILGLWKNYLKTLELILEGQYVFEEEFLI